MRKDNKESEKDDKIVEEMLDFFTMAENDESENRKDMLADNQFLYGEQWDSGIMSERQRTRRPCLTVNQLPQFIRQVTNDQRRNRPSIIYSPVDSGADVDTAEVLTGLVRSIQVRSNSDEAIDTAFFSAVGCGLGYMRVSTRFESFDSMNQEIIIEKIVNPLSVYYGNIIDYEDATKCVITEDISRDQYKREYPDFEIVSADRMAGSGDAKASEWTSDDMVRVAEYFRKTFKDDEVVLLNDGNYVLRSIIEEKGGLPFGLMEVDSRKTKVPTIEWFKSNGYDILDRGTIPGIYIPIIPVIGEEFYLDGVRHLKGMVRDAKDSQRMYNVWVTAQTELIALAPKAPMIGVEGQFEGHEDKWNSANIANYAYLEYKAVNLGGTYAPPPQRSQYEPPVQAITQARMQAAQDLKAVTGMYDASLGQVSNERSGKAIRERKESGDTVNYHYADNLARSMRYMGKIILDMIPSIYDTARVVRIIGENGDEEKVALNSETTRKGVEHIFDPSVGKYDVVVNVGPSFSTQRQESVDSMMSLMNSAPQVMSLAADLMVRNMDWPGAKAIADRLKRAVPPELLGDEGEQEGIPPQAMAKMQEMDQQLQQLNAHAEQVEQQAQQLAQENEQLKTAQNDKHNENMLKNKELDADIALKMRELDIKTEELAIKREELDIKEAETIIKAHTAAKPEKSLQLA